MQKPLYGLKENPLSRAIYGDETDVDDLAKSLKETGQLTPLLIKPDGTILSGHRRYRAARKAGLITLNVEVRTPRDKAEEELIIISANKQRKKTPEQEIKEVERLRAIYEGEGLQRKSEARKQAWEEYREQKTDDIPSPKIDLLETNKSTNITKTPTPEPEFNIEEAYEDAMERTAGKESQTQPLERQSTPKPAPINMRKKIAHEMGVSENYVHQLQTVGDAVKAGVPEAKEALDRANKGEITVNRAYEITKQATKPKSAIPVPFSGGEKVEPGMAQDCMSAALKVNPWVLGIERELTQAEPKISVGEAKQLLAFIGTHIGLLEGFRQSLRDYIAKRGGDQSYGEEESDRFSRRREAGICGGRERNFYRPHGETGTPARQRTRGSQERPARKNKDATALDGLYSTHGTVWLRLRTCGKDDAFSRTGRNRAASEALLRSHKKLCRHRDQHDETAESILRAGVLG